MNTRNRPFTALLILLIFGAGIAAGIFGWIWISGGDSQPSRPVEEVLAELEATNDAANSEIAAEISTIIPAAVGTAVAEFALTRPTATPTDTPTITPTPTNTLTSTPTPTPTITPTPTDTPIDTPTITPTPTNTLTSTPTPTPTSTYTPTKTPTLTYTPSVNGAANSEIAAEISTIIPAAVGTAVAEAVSASIPQAVDSALAEAAARAVSGAESSPVEFRIVSEQSRVTFTLEEDLRGARTTVIGSTSEVAGSIMVNSGSPAASSVGAIVINARTLETDNSFRNRALRSAILQSAQDDYEFIVFTPQSLSNFSAEIIDIGETITFDITGDLRIVEVTRTVTFSATVTLDSPTQISGSAAANVLYADFNLVIPQVPGVANVTDDVKLDIHFVAVSD